MKRFKCSDEEHELPRLKSQSELTHIFVQKMKKKSKETVDFVKQVRSCVNETTGRSNSVARISSNSAEIKHDDITNEVEADYDDDNDNDSDLQNYGSDSGESDDSFEVEHFDPVDSIIIKSSKIEMDENERIMLLLLHQARYNTTNRETEQYVQTINDLSYRNCCASGQKPVICYSSWNTLISKVPNAFVPKIYKFFYSKCGDLVGPVLDLNRIATCTKNHEECSILPQALMKMDSSCFFCFISLYDWLYHQLPLLHHKLRLSRPKESKYYHDLNSGNRYNQLIKFNTNNIDTLTLTLTWDGVAYTKDSSKSMWPLVAYLNELPFKDRIINPMLIALQSGKSKPKSDLLLRPLIDQLVELENNPITVLIGESEKKYYVKLLLFIADAPARALALNCSQFNAFNGTRIFFIMISICL